PVTLWLPRPLSCVLSSLSSFFCSLSGDPRDLHSFPTRRSSDLAGGPVSAAWSLWLILKITGLRLAAGLCLPADWAMCLPAVTVGDRKSTRLNSSHGSISYAVFCLKKKKNKKHTQYKPRE